jgi:succinyl-CoA synthetase beta subunit
MCGKRMTTSLERVHMKNGWLCNLVLIQEKIDIEREIYISIDHDRKLQKPVITYSYRGGMSLVEIKKRYPESIQKIAVDVREGVSLQDLLKVADFLGLHEK